MSPIYRPESFDIQLYDYFNKKTNIHERLHTEIVVKKEWFENYEIMMEVHTSIGLPIKREKGNYRFSLFDYYISFIIIRLYVAGLKFENIKSYKNELLKNEYSKKVAEFFFVQALYKTPVKLYAMREYIEFMTDEEFIINSKLSFDQRAYIVIDINEIVGKIYWKDVRDNSFFVGLDKTEENIIFGIMEDKNLKKAFHEIVKDKDNYEKVSIEKKGNKFDLLRKEKIYDVEDKVSEIKKKFPNSHIKIDNIEGSTIKIIVEEKIKIDDLDQENQKLLKKELKKLENK